ncbi:hypothetical protein BGW36DRAFT_426339 [Talaromyces proteolyticus]|uniref:Uncharacterized protein n=1 Tax=Talaromyces proteolyticus TaxID=1131652 RepID=A0AAD4KR84_9EURO|nr:uncharacterized protein BGW36DRAFT_426339 [Talaromyces proteolyticus]KAH8698644.1 hypothetical protein BGW36DRAFT_426339 [Talaromyces proteolyticus]
MTAKTEKLTAVTTTRESSTDLGSLAKKEKYQHPKFGELDLTKDQYDRYERLVYSAREFANCFSFKRSRMLEWLWSWEYIALHRVNRVDSETFERFLVPAEKILALRKKQDKKKINKGLYKQICDVAGDYLLNYTGSIYNQEFDVLYFIGQILWNFYERYPKHIPMNTGKKDPLEHALECIHSFSDSKLVTLIPEVGALVPNLRSRNSELSQWDDGRLYGLSQRVLKLLKCEGSDDGKGVEESGYTINLRRGLARHTSSLDAGQLLNHALRLARKIHGKYHPITWDLTEKLGRFYLNDACSYTLQYYFSDVKGDKVRGVQKLYEDFLNGALEGTNHQSVNVELFRESIAPTLVDFYKNHDQDNKARVLLWKFTESISSELYAEFFNPFSPPYIKIRGRNQLFSAISRLDGCGVFSNFNYNSLETAIFAFDKVVLLSVEPSDEEKMMKWHPLVERLPIAENLGHVDMPSEWIPGLPAGYQPRPFRRSEDNCMVLELPYITYRNFKTSQCYRFGSSYAFYCKGSLSHPTLSKWRTLDNALGKSGLFDVYMLNDVFFVHFPNDPIPAFLLVDSGRGGIEEYVYDKETGSIVARNGPSEKSSSVDNEQKSTPPGQLENPGILKSLNLSHGEAVLGLFNDTPGDLAVIDHQIANGFNLVSAEWIDWRRFVLHNCPPERQPKLMAADGTPIPVLGYIYGTWTDFNLAKSWGGLQVYVVQAKFELSKDIKMPDTRRRQLASSCHFVLSPDDLCNLRETTLSLEDVRKTCTLLNPSLVRFMNRHHMEPQMMCYCFGSTPPDDFEGVKTSSCSKTGYGLMAELSRRDAWDNEFADLYWNKATWKSRREKLEEQAKVETAMRKEWDENYVKGSRHWISVWQ